MDRVKMTFVPLRSSNNFLNTILPQFTAAASISAISIAAFKAFLMVPDMNGTFCMFNRIIPVASYFVKSLAIRHVVLFFTMEISKPICHSSCLPDSLAVH